MHSFLILGLTALVSARPLDETATVLKRTVAGKRGLAYTSASQANEFENYPEITWGYNWGYPSGGLSSEFEFVPMLWGDPSNNPTYAIEWEGNVTLAIKSGSSHLLAFNEPDVKGLSPAEAASSYIKYMQPYASSTVKLGAPAVTNGGAPDGLAWLGEFLGNCTGCTIDFVPFHWYCGYNNINYFADYMAEAYSAGGSRPLWITEFQGENVDCSVAATDAEQVQFMETVLPWLDSLSYVERYAYFGAIPSNSENTYMLDEQGTAMMENGQTYATLTNVNSTIPTSLVA